MRFRPSFRLSLASCVSAAECVARPSRTASGTLGTFAAAYDVRLHQHSSTTSCSPRTISSQQRTAIARPNLRVTRAIAIARSRTSLSAPRSPRPQPRARETPSTLGQARSRPLSSCDIVALYQLSRAAGRNYREWRKHSSALIRRPPPFPDRIYPTTMSHQRRPQSCSIPRTHIMMLYGYRWTQGQRLKAL